ncbi:hypothetical protein NW759_000803 [Fusarium solani]|nr:hypothetical protein NW759_000803 [Fusarium solani]
MRLFHRISASITSYFTPGLHLVIAPAPADACLKSPTRLPVPITTLDKPPGSRWHHRIPRRRSAHPPSFQDCSSDLPLGRSKNLPVWVSMWLLLHCSFRIPRMVKSLIDKDI